MSAGQLIPPRKRRRPAEWILTVGLTACFGTHPYQASRISRNPSLGEGMVVDGAGFGAARASWLELRAPAGASGRWVTIKSNLSAGCSLWSWVWNDFEFVNVHDYGRQIQTAFVSDRGAAHEANPTEAGSRFSAWPGSHQGSPCVQAFNVLPATQVTSASPFEWEPTRWGGGYRRQFVWKDVRIGKEITLDYLGLGPVARYTSLVIVTADVPRSGVEIPSVYLHASLRRFYGYDAATRTLSLQDPATAEGGTLPPSGYGGVIASSPDGARAFGQYGVVDSLGGSVTPAAGGFSYFLFPDPTDTIGPTANATAKIRALHGGLVRGENRMTTFLMSGTLAEVTALMDSLYAHRRVAR
jgi:hypothetical protein